MRNTKRSKRKMKNQHIEHRFDADIAPNYDRMKKRNLECKEDYPLWMSFIQCIDGG